MPIQLVMIPERRLVARPGRQEAPFLFKHDGRFRAMCWVSVGNDGSLYLNPRTGGTSPIEHGEWIAHGAGGFAQVKWGGARQL